MSVLSAGNVQAAPILLRDGELPTPFHHLSAERWYASGWTTGLTFLLLDDTEARQLNRVALEVLAGKPSSTLRLGTYEILIYPFNIGDRLGFAGSPFVTLPPMTPSRCAAEYAPLDGSIAAAPDALGVLRVRTTNHSTVVWPQNSHPNFNSGLRIFDAAGNVVSQSRALLPRPVSPGESIILAVPFRAPKSGEYVLSFSMVAEGDAWCGDLGSSSAKIPLSVKP